MSKILDNPAWSQGTRAAQIQVALQQQADEATYNAKLAREKEIAQQRRDVESAKQAEQFRIQRQKEIEAEQKKLRETESANLDAALRERYFAANPFALESDFQRVKDSLRDDYFIERMKGRQTTEEMFARTSIKM